MMTYINLFLNLINIYFVFWPLQDVAYSMIEMPFGGLFYLLWLPVAAYFLAQLIWAIKLVTNFLKSGSESKNAKIALILNIVPILIITYITIESYLGKP
jgi:hypothetical protein